MPTQHIKVGDTVKMDKEFLATISQIDRRNEARRVYSVTPFYRHAYPGLEARVNALLERTQYVHKHSEKRIT
jgi:hypothetical protein